MYSSTISKHSEQCVLVKMIHMHMCTGKGVYNWHNKTTTLTKINFIQNQALLETCFKM